MTAKVFQLELANIPTSDNAGNAIPDPIGARINRIYADPSMIGFSLAAAYETAVASAAEPSPAAPTHLVLYFEKP
jgi:hypothetical protein